MLAALPVVTTRFAGLEELLDGKDIAVTVPLDDDEAMARAIETYLEDPARAAALGRRARQWVRRQFTWDTLVASMGSFYTGLMQDKPDDLPVAH
jgi:glycosyltransferase involved in cell wall biosynthesis